MIMSVEAGSGHKEYETLIDLWLTWVQGLWIEYVQVVCIEGVCLYSEVLVQIAENRWKC